MPGIIEECVAAGAHAAIIISAGFKETGPEGAALEQQILAIARRGNMRIVGPNCLGVMNPITGLNATFARHGVPGRAVGLGARFGIYFGVDGEVRNYRDALKHDRAVMLRFIAAAIDEGVYFHDYGGAACHHGFCAAMSVADIDDALARLDTAINRLAATV